MPQIQGHLHM
ncbi:rCG52876, partial [Rattus norvegicus]